MNKILISLHWLLNLTILILLLFGQESNLHYDPVENFKYVAIGYTSIMLILSFMITKNHKEVLIHICTALIGVMALFKLFQVSLVTVWPAYVSLIFAALTLSSLHASLFKGWGIWTYLLCIYVLLPACGLINYLRNKLILTTVFDNDLALINGLNPLYTGIGYIATSMGHENYLAYGPLLVLLFTCVVIYLAPLLKTFTLRKDEQNEKITL